MRTLTKEKFKELATFEAGLCVSIYLPTHVQGQEVLNQVDQIALKNQIKQVGKEVIARGFDEHAAARLLQPLHDLLRDSRFWRNQSEGLAIFLAAGHFQYFHLPLQVTPLTFVAYEFYLKPLASLLTGPEAFYLLSLNLQQMELYRADRYTFDRVVLDPSLPQRLEEVVGEDFRQKFVASYGSRVGGHQQATFYGQAKWQADEKQEITQYFRAVDQAIAPVVKAHPAPLLLAGLDHLVSLYRKANSLPDTFAEYLRINPKDLTEETLQGEARELLRPHFEQQRQQFAEQIRQLRDTTRTSTNIEEIVPAAIGGRIEALFLDDSVEIWGVYYKKDARTEVQPTQRPGNTSLTNLIVVQTLLHGGEVFLTSRENMPLDYASVNALFRF